jgi:hypothetical protein
MDKLSHSSLPSCNAANARYLQIKVKPKLVGFQEAMVKARAEDYYARGFFAGDWNPEWPKLPSSPLSREDLRRELTETRPFLMQHLQFNCRCADAEHLHTRHQLSVLWEGLTFSPGPRPA